MTFSFRHIALMAAAGALLTACSDWADHYDGKADTTSSESLWASLQANPQLSDFCEVLQQSRIFRHHRRTSVSYAQLLDGGQSFTVFAPVNGTFNKDSLLSLVQTDRGDSTVEKFFIRNHIAASPHSAVGTGSEVRLLNGKHVSLSAGDVEGTPIATGNVHAKNGTLHVLGARMPYQYNLYEAMTDRPDYQPVGDFLRVYNEDYFDEDASISSGLVDGVPVYVDSVIHERNTMLQQIGLLAAEDSSYWMVAPAQTGWNKAYAMARQYFVYDKTVDKRDSVQHYWTNRSLLEDAIFNMNIQPSWRDSLKSVQYNALTPEYHVFYRPMDGGILSGATPVACSNGTLYQTSDWPFTPEQTFFKVLRTEGERTGYITSYTSCTYNTRSVSADSVSKNAYLDILPQTATSNWTVTFRVDNTLSGTYDICAIILPQTVYNPNQTNLRPCKFRANINYVDTAGVPQTYNCGNVQFTTDPARVDTVVLAKGFTFPACNFDQDNLKVSVQLRCSILARETSRYSREMYLDCIYLRPSTSKED